MKKNGAKKREKKFAKITKLWEEARLFRHDQQEGLWFLCPVCQTIYEVPDDLSGIDNAHIIPEAAGGKRTTLLCKKCNNEFGADQDRWLGDFLKYKRDFFKAFEQEKHFDINGVRFYGRIQIDADGNMSVLVDKKRNPPGTDLRLRQVVGYPRMLFSLVTRQWSVPPDLRLTVPFQLTRKQDTIFVGLLTAGYLAWFEALRYSWVLQSHLNGVREQIKNPEKAILPPGYVQALPKALYSDPVIGAVTIEGMMLPAFILDQWLVMFPSFVHPDAYAKMRHNMNGTDAHFRSFVFARDREPKIRSVSWMNHVLVKPDILTAAIDETEREHLIFLDEENPYPHKLNPLSQEEYESLAHTHGNDVVHLNIDLRSRKAAGLYRLCASLAL